jgi:hypothetical protein
VLKSDEMPANVRLYAFRSWRAQMVGAVLSPRLQEP